MACGIFLHEFRRIISQFLGRLHPRHELLVGHSHKFRSEISAHHAVRHNLVARFIFFERQVLAFSLEIGAHAVFSHDECDLLAIIRIVGADYGIFIFRSHAKRCVGGQCPRSSGPCDEARCSPPFHFRLCVDSLEDCGHGGVLDITVATGLVQLVGAESGSGSGRIGLNGVTFVKVAFAMKLL